MLNRNAFSFEFTVVCLVGISFFNSFATTSSVYSSELSPYQCCSDLNSQGNATGIEVTETTLGVAESNYNIDIPEHLDGKSKNPTVVLASTSTSGTDEEDIFSANTHNNLSILADPLSKCQNASKAEGANQSVSAKDENLNQFTQPYSNSNDSESIITDVHSISAFINYSHSHNYLNVLHSNSTVRNLLEGTSVTTESSYETIPLDKSSKKHKTEQYTSSKFQLINNRTSKSITESNPQESSNYTFEIVLLNSNEQAQEINVSRELTHASKNYYLLQTSILGDSSVKTTQNDIYKERTEFEMSVDSSSSFNSSSILFDFLSIGNSTVQDVQNLFYNTSENDLVNEQLNKTSFQRDIETSSEVESSNTNHPPFTNLQGISSSTHIPILKQVTKQDRNISTISKTEKEGKLNTLSLESDFSNSAIGASPVTSPQEYLANNSTTNFSIHDNEKLPQIKITSPPFVYEVASHSAGTLFSNARTLSRNTDMSIASTFDPVTLIKVTKDIHVKNISGSNSTNFKTEINGISNANSIRETQSIGGSITKPSSSTEIYPVSSTSVIVDQIPSVMLAIEDNHPVSNQFFFSKKHYLSTTRSSTDSYSENEHIEFSTSQTLEKANKKMISRNNLPPTTKETSAIVDSVISTINDIVNKSRNDKILAHTFSDLSSNSIWNRHQFESGNQQSDLFDHSLENKSKDPSSTQTIPATTATPEPTTSRDGSKIFWKPLTNLLLSSQSSPDQEATTEGRIFWNLCFTKKPVLFSPRNPKETLMTKGPGDTKVFWNLCPTKKPYIATPSYHPTETPDSTYTSTASSPLSLFDIPNPSASGSSAEETPSQTTSSEDDLTTTTPIDTTYVTFTEAAPEETTQALEEKKEYLYPIYWNVPTFQCHKYGLNFSRVKDWGLQQNYQDEFRGEEIAILYDPGEFPALLPASGGRRVQRNGGVPQEGSLTRHLSLFQSHLEKLIPNVNFSGLAIIDFEHWRPVWRQNWGSLSPYREFSRLIEKRRHPFWFSTMVELEATYRYELGARVFLLDTLRLGKKLRPQAKWGYYGFPFCFNYTPYNNRASCSYEVQLDNDNMYWLFSETTAYYPSLYLKYNDMYSSKRQRFIKGRLDEALRVAQGVSVYPYVWYKYHDNHHFLTKDDMVNLLKIPKDYGCKGAVIWGASRDVNSRDKCLSLQSYLEEVIGPAVRDIHEEAFREGTVGHEEEEDSEEDIEEEEIEIKEKKFSYDVREFEV